MALPPGPRLPTLVQTLYFGLRPMTMVRRARARHGDCFTLRVWPFGRLVYVTRPEDIKGVFTGDTDTFQAGRANSFMRSTLGPRSVLLLDGADHLRMRKLMLPPFHGDAVRRYAELIREVAEAEIAGWPTDRPFALRPRSQAITLEVILRAVFGIDDPDRSRRFRDALVRLLETGELVLVTGDRRWLGWLPRWRRYRRVRAEVDALIYEEIARRRAEDGRDGRTDILSLLIAARGENGEALTDRELRDELVTLLIAGHETTATALAWTFERLVRNPDSLARLRDEVDRGGDEYVDAVIKEALRVRPVIMDVARELTAPATVAGHELPAGVIVLPAIGLVQSDPAQYPDPEAFRPERFLDGQPAPYTWIPFGGGVRRCLGASFAQLEMKVVIAAVVRAVELRAARPEPEPQRMRNVTLVPRRGAEVVVSPRRSTADEAEPEPATAAVAAS